MQASLAGAQLGARGGSRPWVGRRRMDPDLRRRPTRQARVHSQAGHLRIHKALRQVSRAPGPVCSSLCPHGCVHAEVALPACRWAHHPAPAALMWHMQAPTHLDRIPRPEEFAIELLTMLRKPQLDVLQSLLAPGQQLHPEAPGTPVRICGREVHESGPLARCSGFMDAAARRTLPGLLLRRCRVLSSVQLGDMCQQRVALTACTGEEGLLLWRLQRQRLQQERPCTPATAAADGVSGSDTVHSRLGVDAGGDQGVSGSDTVHSRLGVDAGGDQGVSGSDTVHSRLGVDAGGDQGLDVWRLVSISRDTSDDGAPPYPGRPHPRLSPELVVLALLAALRDGNIIAASGFTLWGKSGASPGWELQLARFRAMLRLPAYHCLLTHEEVELGVGALPTQRHHWQEVRLLGSGSGAHALLVQLCMGDKGCWLVQSISACDAAL